MSEMKKRKLIVGIITVLVFFILGLIPAVLVGVIGYYVFIKPLKGNQENRMPELPKGAPVKKIAPAKEAEPVKEEPVKEEAVSEEADSGEWTERESELNYQMEAMLNSRMYYANEKLGETFSALMESCTCKARRDVYTSVYTSLMIDLTMLKREFTGLILGEYGEENTGVINSILSKDKSVKEINAEFDQLAENFWTYSGWDKMLKCGAYTAFRNMWYYALKRPWDQTRFEKALSIYNFYNATMLTPDSGEEVEVMDHWALLANFSCFKDDSVDEYTNEQTTNIVTGWCSCHFNDEHKEQLASGLKWLKLEKAEYAALCSMEKLKPELEQRKAELALIYG